MARYIIRRTISAMVTLILVSSLVFILLRKMPIEGYFHNFEKLTPSQINIGLENMGLNSPIHIQLWRFFSNLLKGDLGVSNKYRINFPISKLVAIKMPTSLFFGLMAMGLSLLLGIPLGMAMARSATSQNRIKTIDIAGSAYITLVQSIPKSIYHLFIQIYVTELVNKFTRLPFLYSANNPKTWVLPIISLSLSGIASYAMWTRRYMVDESSKDYTLLARAKGVSPAKISSRHIMRNAIVPLVQVMPSSFVGTFMGSLYVESRYSIPGMGGLLVEAIKRQDNTLVQALVLIYTALSIFAVLAGDIAMAAADPRIVLSKGGTR
ncbi:MAG: ABC transporter permease [Eubacteriaceae bacterium]|nr:ABC transporter permease [Eubacteriaceae bacterium]